MAAAVSITDPGELAEDERDDEDEFAPERVSFFAGDQHEREIATSVWRIYLRESVERGFEQPDRARRLLASAKLSDTNAKWRDAAEARRARAQAANAAPAVVLDAPVTPNPQPAAAAPPPPEKVLPMSDLSKQVSDHHASLRKQLGREPTNIELVAAVGASVEAVRGHAKRLGLVLSDGRALRKSAGGGPESGEPPAEGRAPEGQAAHERARGRRASGDQRARGRGLARDRRAASRAREDRRRARRHRQGDRALLDEGSVER